MENRVDISARFAKMWRTSRESVGKSQDYMARALGVSKKTVQNWEAGTSCPSQEKGFAWFVILDLQPLPYYLRLLYPEEFDDLTPCSDDKAIEQALCTVIKDIPSEMKRKILYLLTGAHGSSPLAVMEVITAHLQTPLRDRLNVAQSIATNYEMAQSAGKVKRPDHIQPNMELISSGIQLGKEAVKAGKNSYTTALREAMP